MGDAAIPRAGRGGLGCQCRQPQLLAGTDARFGNFQIPLLSDSGHAVALAYGVWKPLPGGDKDDGEALHGTFIVDRGGSIRWVYIGDRPFDNIDALLAALDPPAETRVLSLPELSDGEDIEQ